MANTALIIGATSSLAVGLCRELGRQGWNLIVAGRNTDELQKLAQDISIRFGVATKVITVDMAADSFSAERFVEEAGTYDAVFMVAGDMGNGDHQDPANIAHVIKVNFTVPAQLLTLIAAHMEAKETGLIVVVSSVAGDRGRQSNYPYGSAKAGLTAFASGLRNRLCKKNVHVMTVKPGFIDTPMTYGMHSPLIASRNYVARTIIHAAHHKKDVVYVPFFWQYIMLIIKALPEFLFKKLTL